MKTLFHSAQSSTKSYQSFCPPAPAPEIVQAKVMNSSQKATLKGHLELSTALNTVDFCLLKGLCCLGFPVLLSSLAPPTQSPLSAVLPFHTLQELLRASLPSLLPFSCPSFPSPLLPSFTGAPLFSQYSDSQRDLTPTISEPRISGWASHGTS